MRSFVFRITIIIFLTYIPAFAILATYYRESIGWILGSLGSIVNFVWLSFNTKSVLQVTEAETKLKAYKGFYFRYLFLIVYSIMIILTVKPEIITFGAGLVAVQMSIYINLLIGSLKKD